MIYLFTDPNHMFVVGSCFGAGVSWFAAWYAFVWLFNTPHFKSKHTSDNERQD